MSPFRALIADDEAVARRHLAKLLDDEPDVQVVAEARDGIEAMRRLQELPIDLLWLDVQMPGMDGFEVLRRARTRPLIVFTTAHGDYALAAIREGAVEYLLKPIAPEDIKRTMCKVRERARGRSSSEDIVVQEQRQMDESRSTQSQILVSVHDVLKPLRLDQIICLEARDKCTIIHTPGEGHEADKGLGELEARLPGDDFVRIHRRHIVNVRYIKELRRWGHRQYKVELTTTVPTELYVSRSHVDTLLARLGGTQ